MINHKILLMNKIVGNMYPIFQTRKLVISVWIATPSVHTTEQEQLIIQLQISFNQTCIREIKNPIINTYKDHRMAMSFAPVSMMFPGVKIDDPMVVSKSYPGFWDDLRKAGFDILNA